MGRHGAIKQSPAATGPSGSFTRRHRAPARSRLRYRASVAICSFGAATAFLLVNVVDPYSGAVASPRHAPGPETLASAPAQHLVLTADTHQTVEREAFTVKVTPKPKPKPDPEPATTGDDTGDTGGGSNEAGAPAAPSAPAPNPGSAQAYARSALQARGMGDDQFSCLVSLWNRESGWNVYAQNPSGAYGIPQALPGSKMASAGPNWQSNPKTQVDWGLGYVIGRYGTPCGAWSHSESTGWY